MNHGIKECQCCLVAEAEIKFWQTQYQEYKEKYDNGECRLCKAHNREENDWRELKTKLAAFESYASQLEDGNRDLLAEVAFLEGTIVQYREAVIRLKEEKGTE